MKQLHECISENIQIIKDDLSEIISKFQFRDLKKGEYLLMSGNKCREMAFIESGYLRMFDLADGKEITLWIGSNSSFITSLSSFVFETPNYWNIQAVTDCKLLVISRQAHFELLKRFPKWMEFDNLLLARSFALLEQSMFSQLHTTAQQRYQVLFEENPAIFNHVPLQHIASMLGIMPETLSRLRKNLSRPIS
ncbi:MAG: cyclic nucleotide-binding protein [Flavobacteriales bacterium]|nr:MAG: cyclic nucleotide-binding protein [Flavobacteriales bacterium]